MQEGQFILVRIKKTYLDKWFEENDGGSLEARWAVGLLCAAERFWYDGSPVVLWDNTAKES